MVEWDVNGRRDESGKEVFLEAVRGSESANLSKQSESRWPSTMAAVGSNFAVNSIVSPFLRALPAA
jgi:hypothetical protein